MKSLRTIYLRFKMFIFLADMVCCVCRMRKQKQTCQPTILYNDNTEYLISETE